MNATQIEPTVQLVKHVFAPAGGLLGAPAVADAVAADDDDAGVRPLLEHFGKRPHENMETAVRLQVARAVGDDLIAWRKGNAAPQPQPEIGRASCRERV